MKLKEYIKLTGEHPEDMFGGDWKNIIAELSEENIEHYGV